MIGCDTIVRHESEIKAFSKTRGVQFRMDMIKQYGSDSPTSNEENNETFALASQELDVRSVCKVYLITYSQMEEDLFPTRRSFVNAVFQSFTDSSVVQWSCCLEQHIFSV